MENDEIIRCLSAIRQGDSEAFEALYEGLKIPVYTVILRITQDRQEAEDLLQKLFVKLYRFPPKDEVKNPRAYILQSARNMALDSVRSRREALPLDLFGETEKSVEHDAELRLDIEDALSSLAFEDRQIVTLHLNGGLSFRETAEIMGMPLGTVLWRYGRALKALRDKLSGGGI